MPEGVCVSNESQVCAVPPEFPRPLPEEHLKSAESWARRRRAWAPVAVMSTPTACPKQRRPPPHLHISAAGHFAEVLLLLQSFVNLIVRHAEAAQPSLDGVVSLSEDDELGHIWHADDLAVHLRGEVDRFLGLPTVYQPESAERANGEEGVRLGKVSSAVTVSLLLPGRHVGGKRDAVVYERQWSGSRYVFPLRRRGSS